MKISVREALEMLLAVNQLDSYSNGSGTTHYKYAGQTRIDLAIARRKLKAIQEDFTEARNNLITEISGKGGIPPMNGHFKDVEEQKSVLAMHSRFGEAELALLKADVEVSLKKLSVEDLKLEENPIPAGVLEGLGSLIDLDI